MTNEHAIPEKSDALAWAWLPMRRYARFSGRSGRREFWWFSAAQFLFYALLTAAMIAYFVVGIDALDSDGDDAGFAIGFISIFSFLAIFYIALFVPTLAVTVRRLHDIGLSGWIALPLYLAGWFLSFIGWIIYAIVMALPGQDAENQFGPPVYGDQLADVFE